MSEQLPWRGDSWLQFGTKEMTEARQKNPSSTHNADVESIFTCRPESCTRRVWSARRLWRGDMCWLCRSGTSDRSVCLQCRSRSPSSVGARCGATTPWSDRCGWSLTPSHRTCAATGWSPRRPSRRPAPALWSPASDGIPAAETYLEWPCPQKQQTNS